MDDALKLSALILNPGDGAYFYRVVDDEGEIVLQGVAQSMEEAEATMLEQIKEFSKVLSGSDVEFEFRKDMN